MTDRALIEEALGMLQEEAAEVILAVSKIRRFGFLSFDPADPTKKTNITALHEEVGDFELLKTYLINKGVLSSERIEKRMEEKQERIGKYSNLFKDEDSM